MTADYCDVETLLRFAYDHPKGISAVFGWQKIADRAHREQKTHIEAEALINLAESYLIAARPLDAAHACRRLHLLADTTPGILDERQQKILGACEKEIENPPKSGRAQLKEWLENGEKERALKDFATEPEWDGSAVRCADWACECEFLVALSGVDKHYAGDAIRFALTGMPAWPDAETPETLRDCAVAAARALQLHPDKKARVPAWLIGSDLPWVNTPDLREPTVGQAIAWCENIAMQLDGAAEIEAVAPIDDVPDVSLPYPSDNWPHSVYAAIFRARQGDTEAYGEALIELDYSQQWALRRRVITEWVAAAEKNDADTVREVAGTCAQAMLPERGMLGDEDFSLYRDLLRRKYQLETGDDQRTHRANFCLDFGTGARYLARYGQALAHLVEATELYCTLEKWDQAHEAARRFLETTEYCEKAYHAQLQLPKHVERLRAISGQLPADVQKWVRNYS